jgi:hypothetical protein
MRIAALLVGVLAICAYVADAGIINDKKFLNYMQRHSRSFPNRNISLSQR